PSWAPPAWPLSRGAACAGAGRRHTACSAAGCAAGQWRTLGGDAAATSDCEYCPTPQWLLAALYQPRTGPPGESAPATPGGSAARTTHALPGSLPAAATPAQVAGLSFVDLSASGGGRSDCDRSKPVVGSGDHEQGQP